MKKNLEANVVTKYIIGNPSKKKNSLLLKSANHKESNENKGSKIWPLKDEAFFLCTSLFYAAQKGTVS